MMNIYYIFKKYIIVLKWPALSVEDKLKYWKIMKYEVLFYISDLMI